MNILCEPVITCLIIVREFIGMVLADNLHDILPSKELIIRYPGG